MLVERRPGPLARGLGAVLLVTLVLGVVGVAATTGRLLPGPDPGGGADGGGPGAVGGTPQATAVPPAPVPRVLADEVFGTTLTGHGEEVEVARVRSHDGGPVLVLVDATARVDDADHCPCRVGLRLLDRVTGAATSAVEVTVGSSDEMGAAAAPIGLSHVFAPGGDPAPGMPRFVVRGWFFDRDVDEVRLSIGVSATTLGATPT